MSFTQKIFSSFQNYQDGDTRIGEPNRIWYSSASNTLRIQLDDTPGGTIVGRGVGGFIQYTDLSVIAGPATAGGSLSFNISNGVFTYAPSLSDRIVSPDGLKTAVIDNTGATTFSGDLIPAVNTYNLGTLEKPWKDIYVSQGSIVIADTDPDVDGVSISNTEKYIVIDRGGLKVTDNSGTYEIFQLDDTGKLILKSEQPLLTSTPAVSLVGNLSGNQLPTTNLGVMLQATGTQDQPSRIYLDGVGTYDSANAYPAFIGRAARGTAASPLPIQSGDTIARFGGNAYGTTVGLNSISHVRMDMVAAENQTSINRGTRIEFWTTPIGSAAPTCSLHVDSDGIDLSDAANSGAGIKFKNGSLLKYWPSVAGNNTKILRTDGTDFFWSNETVVAGQVIFKGDWSAAYPPPGGNPEISDATGLVGWQWIVSAAGTQDLGSGDIDFAVGDLVIHNGTHYIKIDGTTPQVQSNWTETNSALPAFIKNKPTLATVATSGSYDDLSNKPSIPVAQVNSDWNASSGLAQILNKPTIPTQYTDTLARAAITLSSNSPTGITSTLAYSSGAFTFTSAAATSANTANTVVARDANGDFTARTITATQFAPIAGTTSVAPIKLTQGTLLTTPEAGAIEFASGVMYATPNQTTRGMVESKMIYYNTAQAVLVNNTTEQSIFGLANGVAVSYATRYRFKIVFTARATADNVSLFFALGGTATYFRGNYHATVGKGSYGPGMMPVTVIEVYGTTDGQVRNTINISQGGVGGTYFQATVEGFVDTQYSGYIKPVVALSPAPGASSFIDSKSYMEIYPVGPAASGNADTVIGNWS